VGAHGFGEGKRKVMRREWRGRKEEEEKKKKRKDDSWSLGD